MYPWRKAWRSVVLNQGLLAVLVAPVSTIRIGHPFPRLHFKSSASFITFVCLNQKCDKTIRSGEREGERGEGDHRRDDSILQLSQMGQKRMGRDVIEKNGFIFSFEF
jgi:hypothetical protein